MRRSCSAATLAAAAIAAGMSNPSWSQDYPSRPIRIYAPESGTLTDVIARLIGQGISTPLGQSVIVENRPGNLTQDVVAKSQPDGYTMLCTGNITWITPLLAKTSYDPLRDFAAVSIVGRAPAVLVVSPQLPVNSVKDLIALAKSKPGALDYASGPSGGDAHLTVELLKAMAHVSITRIPYKGATGALEAVVSGQVPLMFAPVSVAIPNIKSGKLHALAVTSATPSALMPGLPTVAASGLPDYEYLSLIGLFAPTKTPTAIVERLNREVVRTVNEPDVKQKFLNAGIEAAGSSPDQLTSIVKSQMDKMGKVIRDAGIKQE